MFILWKSIVVVEQVGWSSEELVMKWEVAENAASEKREGFAIFLFYK